MDVTPDAITRTAREWGGYAGEPVTVEQIGGAIYGFCSELGARRIHYRYRFSKPEKVRAEFSPGRQTWFFVLDMQRAA